MIFNSLPYYLFLPAAVMLYFVMPPKGRNPLLLALSYFFYLCWSPRYALLMLFSTLTTYACALLIEREAARGGGRARQRLWLVFSLAANLLILFFFKYFNFAASLLEDALTALGLAFQAPALDVLLPVGISFYTFQALGYTMDVYRNELPAEKNPVDYALFVSFFPQLVAGPIERSGNLLPQIKTPRRFTLANLREGLLLGLWGLFKKIVIADRLAILVNAAFGAEAAEVTGARWAVAAVAFSLQIYCDFSAYSDIARGSARILGFRLMRNFNAPYLAQSIQEFWRRWHISLSTWFKDYLYFPLGGSRAGTGRSYLNLLVVFLVSGLWHGAALTFLAWGLAHGLLQMLGRLTRPLRDRLLAFTRVSPLGGVLAAWRGLCTFALVTAAFVFFRAETIAQALTILRSIAHIPFSAAERGLTDLGLEPLYRIAAGIAAAVLFIVDALARKRDLAAIVARGPWTRYAAYFALLAAILTFGAYGAGYDPQAFIYFQF